MDWRILLCYCFKTKQKTQFLYTYKQTLLLEMVKTELLKEFGFEEEVRDLSNFTKKTGFPKPAKYYHFSWEVYDLSLEEPYYWVLDQLKEFMPIIEKLEDTFSAAENSAFFGSTQQRLGAQQDKITGIIVSVGKLVKELFQIVRELRIIKERRDYYKGAEAETQKDINRRSKSAEITLKGLFVDLVQGGGKSPASVYGMAQQLEFITLPDLFFDAPPFASTAELESHIKGLEKDFNKNVLRVLHRHLNQFREWKVRTAEEHKNRERFQLKYLQQHYSVIQTYLVWLKPYLRNVQRLAPSEKRSLSADIVSTFEGSMLDIEFLARKPIKTAHACILVTFNYRTRPELKVVQDGYQRGPVHIGKVDINYRVYGWSDEQLQKYKDMKNKEILLLMGDVSSSLYDAVHSMGDELLTYLDEAKGKEEKEEVTEPPKKSFMEKFLGDFYQAPVKKKELKVEGGEFRDASSDDIKKAIGTAKTFTWITYNVFKKAHRMITW